MSTKLVFRTSRDPHRFLHGLRPRSDQVSPLQTPSAMITNPHDRLSSLDPHPISSSFHSPHPYDNILRQFPDARQLFSPDSIVEGGPYPIHTSSPEYTNSSLLVNNRTIPGPYSSEGTRTLGIPSSTAARAQKRQQSRQEAAASNSMVERLVGRPRPNPRSMNTHYADIPTPTLPVEQPSEAQLSSQHSALTRQADQVTNFIMGKRFLPTTIGTSEIPPSDPRLLTQTRPKLRSHDYNTRRDPLNPLNSLRKDDSKIAAAPDNREELLRTLQYFQKDVASYYTDGNKNMIKGREELLLQCVPSDVYQTNQNSQMPMQPHPLERHEFAIRDASKNTDPQKVKPQPSPESKKQSPARGSDIQGQGSPRRDSLNISPRRVEEATQALHKAINQSSLSILEKKRSVSRQRDPPTGEEESPLLDAKIPQVTYLAESSSLASGSRMAGAIATTTKQPAVILEPTQPPPSAPEKAKRAEHGEAKMNATASAKMYEDALAKGTPTAAGRGEVTEQHSELTTIYPAMPAGTIPTGPMSEEERAQQQILLLSQSEERLVASLEKGEHFIKLMPNDYWEFYQEELQSFKKQIHGTKETYPALIEPPNRTARPLDLAAVQNQAFSKMIPRDDSNATLDFQKAFLRNKEAERYYKMKAREIKEAQGVEPSSGGTLLASSLLSSRYGGLPAATFKTSKFPITQDPCLHPTAIIPDSASYKPIKQILAPVLDPPRAVGIPGKSPTKRLMTAVTTLGPTRLGSAMAATHGERLRSADTLLGGRRLPQVQRECRSRQPTSQIIKREMASQALSPNDPLLQEREYMKDWLLGRMYTNMDWVMQEADKRCQCCQRIHCLNKKKPRYIRQPMQTITATHFYQTNGGPLSMTEASSFQLRLASTSSKFRGNKDIERMLKPKSTASGSQGFSGVVSPLILPQEAIQKESMGGGEDDAPSFKAPSEINLSQERILANQEDEGDKSRTPSIFSPEQGAPELMQIQEHEEHSMTEDKELGGGIQLHQSMGEELEEVMMPIEPRLDTRGGHGGRNNQFNAKRHSMNRSDISEDALRGGRQSSLHTSEKVQAQESGNESFARGAPMSQDTGNFPVIPKQQTPVARPWHDESFQKQQQQRAMRSTYASATPWVSPFKVRHIKRKQKINRVVAHATKNLERPAYEDPRSKKFSDQALMGDGIILRPSVLPRETPDPEEYRLMSAQGGDHSLLPPHLSEKESQQLILSQRSHPEENEYLNATIQQIMEQEKLPVIEKYATIGSLPESKGSQRIVRWQDQIEDRDADVRVGTAEKGKTVMSQPEPLVPGKQLMAAIQEEGRKKRKKQPKEAGVKEKEKEKQQPPVLTAANLPKGTLRLGSTLLSEGSVAFSGSSQTPLRVFDVNKSMVDDRSLRKEEVRLAIRRPSPEDLFKMKGASKTAVGFYKPHGGRKIIGGAVPQRLKKEGGVEQGGSPATTTVGGGGIK